MCKQKFYAFTIQISAHNQQVMQFTKLKYCNYIDYR